MADTVAYTRRDDTPEELGETTPSLALAIRATQHLAPSTHTIVACAKRRIPNIEYGQL